MKKYVIKHAISKNYWKSIKSNLNDGYWVENLASASRFTSKYEALKDIENFCLYCDKKNIDLR